MSPPRLEPRERDALLSLTGLLYEAEKGVNPLLADLTDAADAWRAGFYCPPDVLPTTQRDNDDE